jgi:hypothetical protein
MEATLSGEGKRRILNQLLGQVILNQRHTKSVKYNNNEGGRLKCIQLSLSSFIIHHYH